MPSALGRILQRIQGIIDGDGVRDSSVYLQNHQFVVDLLGTDAGVPGILVRALNAQTNAPSTIMRIDKDGTLIAPAVAQLNNTAPTSSAPGDVAASGASAQAARRDHTHGRESWGSAGDIANAGAAAAAGSSGKTADASHVHPLNFGSPTALQLNGSASDGTAATAAHSDHAHAVTVPKCRVYNSANISISSGVVTPLTFNSERYDNDAIHDPVSNTSRLTCKTAGTYRITGLVRWAASASGSSRVALIALNNTSIIASADAPFSASRNSETCVTCDYDLAVNDYVELQVSQDTGGALNVLASGNYSPEFMMSKIG